MKTLARWFARRRKASRQTTVPWTHYTDFSPAAEYLIGIRRVANGKQIGRKIELFRLPYGHPEVDVRVKVQQAIRHAALANESWSNS